MILPEEAHQRVREIWNRYYPSQPTPEQLRELLLQSAILDQAERSNLRAVFFGYHDFSIYHLNRNTARYFGAEPDEILADGPRFIISCIQPRQVEAAIRNTRFTCDLLYSAPAAAKKDYGSTYVNCNISSRQGDRHRCIFQSFPLMYDEQGSPLLGMFLIHDCEPFLADGVWWYRYKIGEQVYHYHAETDQLLQQDIISPRELEILRMVAEGATSKEIAARLYLSVNTVDNHRRNMLKRTGAVDSSALIHVAKICQIID